MVYNSITEDELAKGLEAVEEIAPGVNFHYGVKDGKVYGYMHQEGLEYLMDYCKDIRQASAEKSHKMRMEDPLAEDYIIPMVLIEAIKWETNGEIDPREIAKSGDPKDWEPLDKIIETRFPMFKLTNRKIWRPIQSKQLFKP